MKNVQIISVTVVVVATAVLLVSTASASNSVSSPYSSASSTGFAVMPPSASLSSSPLHYRPLCFGYCRSNTEIGIRLSLNSPHRHLNHFYASSFLPSSSLSLVRDVTTLSEGEIKEERSNMSGRTSTASITMMTDNRNSKKRRIRDRNGTWSASARRTESPLGVRRRVRSVLERAKRRTGIRNGSNDSNTKSLAEAASFGTFFLEDSFNEEAFNIDVMNGEADSNDVDDVNSREREANGFESDNVECFENNIVVPNDNDGQNSTLTPKYNNITPKIPSPELEVIRGDTTGAVSLPLSPEIATSVTLQSSSVSVPVAAQTIQPAEQQQTTKKLPFRLPKLSAIQKEQLRNGERVQFQSDMGREGNGFVAVDVRAPASAVWECLLDFDSYPKTIPTCRSIEIYDKIEVRVKNNDTDREEEVIPKMDKKKCLSIGVPSVTRAAFTLSKFRLKVGAIHKYQPHPLGDFMVFSLDPTSTNAVLKSAQGVWHTQTFVDDNKMVRNM